MADILQAPSGVAWPDPDPGRKTLAESAARLLVLAQQGSGFQAALPIGDAPARPRSVVAQHRAWDALLTLFDLAPDWARSVDLEPPLETLVTALSSPEPIDELLASSFDEFVVSESLLENALERMPAEVEPVLPRRALPCAVAAIAAARARARLAANAAGLEPTDADGELPIGDLLLQAHALLLLDAEPSNPAIHPYVIHAVARAAALCSLATTETSSPLDDAVAGLQGIAKRVTPQLLAEDILQGPRSVNGVALSFCAATLALPPERIPRYVDAALKSCAAAQDATGMWSEGRRLAGHIDPDTQTSTFLSSHDVAAAAAEALLWNAKSASQAQVSDEVVLALRRAISHASDSVMAVAGGDAGWAAQATFERTVVETDATGAVLRLSVTTRRTAETWNAARALAEFDLVWHPDRDPVAPYLKWDNYITSNEPDAANPFLPLLHEKFVEPIRAHGQRDRRPWARPRGRSLLLFGPSGTTKTTVVKAMAQGLGWPLVTLSPGAFIRDGLEHVEKRAISVFKLLEHLAEVVVLFDECDELFRSREHSSKNDNDQMRSISAFMTASMLPKLQDLRDRERIIFVIATNYFDQIDSAVKRVGRIDHIVGVGWPDTAQRKHMIETELSGSKAFKALESKVQAAAVAQLVNGTRYCIRGDVVALASKLGYRAKEIDNEGRVPSVVDSLTEKAPQISRLDRDAFKRDAGSSSETHKPGRGELRE